jgi:phosphotransferase system HPr (HPr) family protein
VTLTGDLHARPAGLLAMAAAKFASAIELSAGASRADAKSVLGVMGIGATSGQLITVRATGADAGEAVAALVDILSQATVVGG